MEEVSNSCLKDEQGSEAKIITKSKEESPQKLRLIWGKPMPLVDRPLATTIISPALIIYTITAGTNEWRTANYAPYFPGRVGKGAGLKYIPHLISQQQLYLTFAYCICLEETKPSCQQIARKAEDGKIVIWYVILTSYDLSSCNSPLRPSKQFHEKAQAYRKEKYADVDSDDIPEV